jgi:hypothetical protein
MAYRLEAFLGTQDALRSLAEHHGDLRIVPLSQGIAIAPLTPDLRASLASMVDIGDPDPSWPFRKLSKDAGHRAVQQSGRHRLAYVEAEYFGGAGDQAAVVWEGGAVRNGPLATENAIDQALRDLGVVANAGTDEFDTVGLNRWRSTSEWLERKGDPPA